VRCIVQVYMPKQVAGDLGKEVLKTGSALLVKGILSETPEGGLNHNPAT
jgi:hypothetical protein